MDIEAVRAYFSGDKFSTELAGISIEACDKQYARCRMPLDERHRNAWGGVMGGVIFTLADFAFAVATNAEEDKTVTSASQISYLAMPKGSVLFAETRCLHWGRTACTFEIQITDDLGTAVASALFNGIRVEKHYV